MYKLLNNILKEKEKERDRLLLEKETARIEKTRGEKGLKGDRGDKGDKGDKGDVGADGVDGKDGIDGVDGVDGKDGADGRSGLDGVDGINGKPGKDGIDGKDGEKGERGERGLPGIDGIDGLSVKGEDGTSVKDVKISSEQELLIKLDNGVTINAGKLPKGEAGKDGRRGGGGTTKVYVDAAIATATDNLVHTIVAGTNISVDSTDPAYPIVSAPEGTVIAGSGDYILTATDDTINYTGSGSYTCTLLNAGSVIYKVYNIKNSGTGTITVVGTGGQLIDGDTSMIILPGVVGSYPCMNVKSDGTGWLII